MAHRPLRIARGVGRDDDVGQFMERRVGRDDNLVGFGVVVPDVHCGASETTVAEGAVQGPLVHDRAAADIDQVRVGLEGRKNRLADEVGGAGGVGHGHDEELSISREVAQVRQGPEPLEARRLAPLLGGMLGHG